MSTTTVTTRQPRLRPGTVVDVVHAAGTEWETRERQTGSGETDLAAALVGVLDLLDEQYERGQGSVTLAAIRQAIAKGLSR